MTVSKVALMVLALAYPTLASAQHQGSLEDQIACTPDVYRLCSAQVPNEDAIVACLARSKAALSPACRRVFSQQSSGRQPSEEDD